MVATHPMIELRRLHRNFGQTRAVDDVSFAVPRGSVFGYIGPNGAGKTTSMRILATLEAPSQGDAFVDGFSCVNDPDRVRRRLGFMPDAFGAYSDVNCVEYLDFFARAHGLVGRERGQAVRRVIDFAGMHHMVDKPIDGLSKGMKQRLCLGRAMIHDPAVLVLDEPAAGLDPRARIELRNLIRRLADDDGKTVLVSSHILTELAEICDRIGIIEHGRLLVTGSVDEIRAGLQDRAEVRIRVIDTAAPLAAWLGEQPDVSDIRLDGELVRFALQGDRPREAALLREIVTAGFEVVEFGAHAISLEDLFMRITKGVVQ